MSKEAIMNTTETKELVRNWYGGVATGNASSCGPTTPAGGVISNGVIILVPARRRVARGAFGVRRRGGRIAIADVANPAPGPAELASAASLLCAFLGGAATTRQIEGWLAAAGFID